MYKVFGDYADYTDTDTLIDAFLMAYHDGVGIFLWPMAATLVPCRV